MLSGDLINPRVKPMSPSSLALKMDSFTTATLGNPLAYVHKAKCLGLFQICCANLFHVQFSDYKLFCQVN